MVISSVTSENTVGWMKYPWSPCRPPPQCMVAPSLLPASIRDMIFSNWFRSTWGRNWCFNWENNYFLFLPCLNIRERLRFFTTQKCVGQGNFTRENLVHIFTPNPDYHDLFTSFCPKSSFLFISLYKLPKKKTIFTLSWTPILKKIQRESISYYLRTLFVVGIPRTTDIPFQSSFHRQCHKLIIYGVLHKHSASCDTTLTLESKSVFLSHNNPNKKKTQLVTKYLYEKLQLVALNYFVNFRNLLEINL